MISNSGRLITSQKAKEIDLKAKERCGISVLVLMENAGKAVAEEAMKVLKNQKEKVAIFCGKGNKGGDGFVAARHLLTYGIKPEVFLAGKISEVNNEAKINLEIFRKLKLKILEVSESNLNLVKREISKYELIIDALLGVGLSGEVRGIFRDLIESINSSRAFILAVDIPSGLDATTGRVLGCCVKADRTVTFVAKKRGMVIGDGPKYCGRVVVKDLGIPL